MPRSNKDAPLKRKSSREKRGIAKASKPQAAKKSAKSAGSNRAEGIRLFKIAGRPTREQFQLVYGDRGNLMTWTQRATAGVPASKFQAALNRRSSRSQ